MFSDVRGIFITIDEYDASALQYFLAGSPKAWRDSSTALTFRSSSPSRRLCNWVDMIDITSVPIDVWKLSSIRPQLLRISMSPATVAARSDFLLCRVFNSDWRGLSVLSGLCSMSIITGNRQSQWMVDSRSKNPPNSEINELVLSLWAESAHAVQALQVDKNKVEFRKIPYPTLPDHFTLTDLKANKSGRTDTVRDLLCTRTRQHVASAGLRDGEMVDIRLSSDNRARSTLEYHGAVDYMHHM
ncbi:hypothetical protein K440DRAFT_643534 [Wilcoxina mikolae CBS 423.85]|nr:hypothetical protein K440DRAFT_643534 [Wilcoxina mikolae CBS 423.85]